MIISVHQPNFLPWLGYFHKIARSDQFVLLDDVQFTKGSVANRSFILNKDGVAIYLTVPVRTSKKMSQHYNETEIFEESKWSSKVINTIRHNYNKSPFFETIFPPIENIISQKHPVLSVLNIKLLQFVLDYLDIRTTLILSSDLGVITEDKNQRLIDICRKLGATIYLSGAGAKAYNDESAFRNQNIRLLYTKFSLDKQYQAHDENGKSVQLNVLHFLMMYSPETVRELIYCKDVTY